MDPPADFKVPEPRPDPIVKQPPQSSAFPSTSYVEPSWSCTPSPEDDYSLEVLKNGQIIDHLKHLQTKSHWSFGRLPTINNFELAHPTISRFHAVLQYRGEAPAAASEGDSSPSPGWYIYDLGSTHGTFVNKQRIPSRTYIRLRVGYMLKMGASTRTFILLGPQHDEEAVQVATITEMKQQRQKAVEELLLKQEQERLEKEEEKAPATSDGISWGMAEDAEDEPDLSVNPFSLNAGNEQEELFLDDPKKTLRGFFEREGLELEYKTEDLPQQTFQCSVTLPLDDASGRPIVARVTHKGKKKDCVAQCALEACRILDRHGVLRKANQEAAVVRRRRANSDSDNDDDYLDRTGDIERRRQLLKRKAAEVGGQVAARTYEELLEEQRVLQEGLVVLQGRIEESKRVMRKGEDKERASGAAAEVDDLDEFMQQLDKGEKKVDKVEMRRWRLEEQGLQRELKQVQRLIEITRPLEVVGKIGAVGGDMEVGVGKRVKGEVKEVVVKEIVEMKKKDVEDVKEEEEKEEKVEKPSIVIVSDPPKSVVPVVVIEKRTERTVQVEEKNEEEAALAMSVERAELQEKKKARQRVRMRKQVRDNVDMEETVEEAEEKFTDWLPPSNQSGDGTTALNEKLGY